MRKRFLGMLFVWLMGVAAMAWAQAEPAFLTKNLPGQNLQQVTQAVKAALVNHNYSFVREQTVDSRLVPTEWEAKSVLIIYFCNFAKMNQALAIDVRAAQFLPCRITLFETRDGVEMTVVNPAWVSESLGNPLLHIDCLKLKADYLSILEEVAM